MCAKWERMWGRPDNQEVGLEAATLERVRNSSLVKWSCADNVAGLKRTAEAVSLTQWCGWVGERPACSEAVVETYRGVCGSENAGMSSECRVRISAAG